MESQEKARELNPFIFPPETDLRFYLLISLIILSFIYVFQFLIAGTLIRWAYWPAFLLSIGAALVVFRRSLNLARKDAQQRINKQSLQPFPPPTKTDPLRQASLHQMDDYMHLVIDQIPIIKALNPRIVWDESSGETGVAFGFGTHKFVCIRKGLHDAFVVDLEKFKSIFLHELGHLKNRDVDKTVLSIALGRSYFPVMLVVLSLLDAYWAWAAVEKIASGQDLTSLWEGGLVIATINFQIILIMVFVEIIRSSILRVREYYADARARLWMGKPDPFFCVFAVSKHKKDESLVAEESNSTYSRLPLWFHKLCQKTRKSLLALHPTSKRRIETLRHPDWLFAPSYEMTFFAGVLAGLVINVSLLLAIVVTDVWNYLRDFVDTDTLAWGGILTNFLILVFDTILKGFTALIPVFLTCFAISSTTGLQIQAASLSDNVAGASHVWITPKRLAKLSCTLSLGFVLGCLLAPTGTLLSLWLPLPGLFTQGLLPLLISLLLLWAGVFGLWMLQVHWFSRQLYPRHVGEVSPRNKQRFLVVTSAIALAPVFSSASLSQVFFGLRRLCSSPHFPNHTSWLCPESLSQAEFGQWIVLIIILGLILQSIVWGIAFLVMTRLHWLKPTRCTNCGNIIAVSHKRKITVDETCPHCNAPLRMWMHSPPPLPTISLPPLPELGDQPPPL